MVSAPRLGHVTGVSPAPTPVSGRLESLIDAVDPVMVIGAARLVGNAVLGSMFIHELIADGASLRAKRSRCACRMAGALPVLASDRLRPNGNFAVSLLAPENKAGN